MGHAARWRSACRTLNQCPLACGLSELSAEPSSGYIFELKQSAGSLALKYFHATTDINQTAAAAKTCSGTLSATGGYVAGLK